MAFGPGSGSGFAPVHVGPRTPYGLRAGPRFVFRAVLGAPPRTRYRAAAGVLERRAAGMPPSRQTGPPDEGTYSPAGVRGAGAEPRNTARSAVNGSGRSPVSGKGGEGKRPRAAATPAPPGLAAAHGEAYTGSRAATWVRASG
ncbi:hypothetical protein GCM10010381_57430 [Streptomyces xantholiticus]|nr:hypothetical protein GCM10010381_57430 [Streptomyces xantholiticus]